MRRNTDLLGLGAWQSRKLIDLSENDFSASIGRGEQAMEPSHEDNAAAMKAQIEFKL